jgi:predicted metal-binding membrane protein
MRRPLSLAARQRLAVLTGLAGVTALSWAYLLHMDWSMKAAMRAGVACELRPWTGRDLALTFAMWVVMMVGMMVPSAVPMSLLYASVARRAREQGSPVGSTFAFVAGYVAAWTLFSAAATAAQWGLERGALLSPMLASTSPAFGGLLLAGAGAYQWTKWKSACLEHCRAPAYFLSSHWREGGCGAFRMGAAHGLYCLGCCAVLMGLLFFGGVMNLLWVAGLTLFVLLEKLAPHGATIGRAGGVVLLAAGGAQLVSWLAGRG